MTRIELRHRRAFTLVELLVVIVILLLVTVAVIPIMAPSKDARMLREASRITTSYLAAARAKAIEIGRPVGVSIQPFALANFADGVTATASGPGQFAVSMTTVEVPPPYCGDYADSTILIEWNGLIRGFPRNDSGWQGQVREGDLIRLNGTGPYYRLCKGEPYLDVNGDGYHNPFPYPLGVSATTTAINNVYEPWAPVFKDFSRPSSAADRYTETDDNPLPAAGQSPIGAKSTFFTTMPTPPTAAQLADPAALGALSMPPLAVGSTTLRSVWCIAPADPALFAGFDAAWLPALDPLPGCVNLPKGIPYTYVASGSTRYQRFAPLPYRFEILRQPVPSAAPPAVLPDEIVIDLRYSGCAPSDPFFGINGGVTVMFSPNGQLDTVYIGSFPARAGSPLFLLLGRRDQTFEITNLTPGTQSNLQDFRSIWVSVGRETGLVASAENAIDDNESAFVNPNLPDRYNPLNYRPSIHVTRRLAQSQQTMGGK